MKPDSIDAALGLGWIEMSPDETRALRGLGSQPSDTLTGSLDCNGKPEGTPCGGFGVVLGPSVACFCRNGLCVCFRAPGFALPI